MSNRSKMEELKTEYETIQPSARLKQRVNAKIRADRHSRVLRYSAASLAGICAAGIIALNLSPQLAVYAAELPGLSGVVDVLTFGRYTFDEGTLHAEVETPHISGLQNKELEEDLNREFQEYSDTLIAAFEKDAEELQSSPETADAHYGIVSGYNVLTNNDRYLSLELYVVNTVGSSSTIKKFYTIDKQENVRVQLADLFQPGADYITPISDYLTKEMQRQIESGAVYWFGTEEAPESGFTKIRPDQNFYINSQDQLVICFDKYEIAPGSSGSPEFVIPSEVIASILK